MTLLQVALLDDRAVLAADSRIRTGPVEGPHQLGTGNKLFEIGGCAVASFNCNPPGLSVPDLIRSFDCAQSEPGSLAIRVATKINELPDRGNFGLLICGIGAGDPELWEIESKSARLLRRSVEFGRISTRGTHVAGLDGVPPILDPELLQSQMLSIFRQAADQYDGVGPPYEIATIRRSQPVAVTHFKT